MKGTNLIRLLGFIFVTVFLTGNFLIQSSYAVTILLEDDFDSENSGSEQLNYASFSNWTISDGTVDLIGNGGTFDFLPGNGLYVDLDGSVADSGVMTSQTFELVSCDYELKFDLAGNQRNGEGESVDVSVGSLFAETFSLNQTDPFTTYTRLISVASPTNASIVFSGSGGDNIGLLLDDVKFTKLDCPQHLVAGELMTIDSAALVISGLSASMIWIIPTLVGITGLSAYYIRTRAQIDN